MTIRIKLWYLIVIATVMRLVVAYGIELGNDEVYYYTYALHLQPNYFDHPPGVALLIRLFTLNLWLTNELFVRLGSVVCAALGTLLSYAIGTRVKNERTGFFAAVLYNTSIYASIIAGVFILPDSPQIVFWLWALYLLLSMTDCAAKKKPILVSHWLLFGLVTGLCIQCKVHGVFLWGGYGLYILLYKKDLLLQPMLYMSFCITLIIISPIIYWNINNHFITFTYHSSRVAVHQLAINYNSIIQALLGQFFYNNPINVIITAIAISRYKTHGFLPVHAYRLLLVTGLPIIVVVTLISLFNPTLPHWSAPGFVTLLFIAAAYLDSTSALFSAVLPAPLKSSLILILVVVIGGVLFIYACPGTIGSKNPQTYGSGDFTLDLSGWRNIQQQYNRWLQQPGNNKSYARLKMVSNKWFPASHIEYYLAEPNHTHVVGVGTLNDLHQFAWLNKYSGDLQVGESALCIVPSNYFTDVNEAYANAFGTIKKLHTFVTARGGKTDRYFTLYLLTGYRKNDEVHNLVTR